MRRHLSERDERISDIFYYFERHTSLTSGRTVGRKIGVVQELLCKKLLLGFPQVEDTIIYDPRVLGRSGATHKVEFVFFQPLEVFRLSPGDSVESARAEGLALELVRIREDRSAATVRVSFSGRTAQCTTEVDRPVTSKNARTILEDNGLQLKVSSISGDLVRLSVLQLAAPIATIESKRVGAQRFAGSEKLGSGIQTIEKAKQASLVAVDFDLKYNESALALSGPGSSRPFRSFVILGNGVHWTEHDLSVLGTYVDYTYLVKDSAIIRYADYIRKLAEEEGEDFMDYFMAHFMGLSNTTPDDFEVFEEDFEPLRPEGSSDSLQTTLLAQFGPYPVIDA